MRKYELKEGFYVLLAISDNDGRLSQRELASALNIDKVTMLRAIDALAAQGYVERVDCPDDRRKHHIKLLPKAKPVVRDLRKVYAELNELAFEGSNTAQREAFVKNLTSMVQRLAIGDLPPARMKYSKKLSK